MSEKKTGHFHSGWDHFSSDPGEHDKMFCRVCKNEMTVKRNIEGATSWAESMSGRKHLHDSFSCSFAQEDWHNQARILLERIEKETSREITKILKKEVKEVLENKKTTKKMHWSYLF